MGDPPIFDIGVGDDVPVSDRDLQQRRRNESSKQLPDKQNALRAGLVAILLAIGAIVAVPLLTGRDDVEELGAEAAEAPATDDNGARDNGARDNDARDNPAQFGSDGPGPSYEPTAGMIFQPPAASHLRADDVASRFGETIDTDNIRYGIAYVANGDFTILDHRGISVPEPLIAQDFATVSTLGLLTSGGRTWAIDGADRDRSYLVSNTYIVVGSERPGTIVIIDLDDLVDVGLMAAGLPVPSVALPEGADLLWVQRRGLLVLPRTGGTFELRGIASSLTRISDARAVAASLSGTVYEQCDDTLACVYVVEVNGDAPVDLPFEAGTRFSLSPDGESLVAMTADDTSTLFTMGNAGERVLTVGRVSAIDWAPDSSFVVIVRDDLLEVVYPATGQIVEMTLNDVPDDDSLLVFAS